MTGITSIRLFAESTNRTNKNEVDEDFILKECSRLIEEAKIEKSPINLQLLASLQDIRKISEEEMPEAGKLIPLAKGGLIVHLRASDSKERKKFSLGHEIGHTFFPNFKLKPQTRIDKETGEYNQRDRIECLCDYAASNLLMPYKLFKPEFDRLGFSLNSLQEISKTFQASLEATSLRMVGMSPDKYGFVVWEKKFKPSEYLAARNKMLFEQYRPEKKLRIKFGFGLQNFGHIPADKSLNEDGGVIEKAFEAGKTIKGIENINFGNFKIKSEVEAMSIGPKEKRRIISLIKLV